MPCSLVLQTAKELDWDPNGEFDEGGCRIYICRVGEIAVNRYLFSAGMREVYGCLLLKYGWDSISDAISLFHEILEDKDCDGAGLGFDEDIFRPWKDIWRRRKFDQSDPWQPHCGDYVFPAATPRAIRRMRAFNFVISDPMRVFAGQISAETDDIPVLVHQRLTTLESQRAATQEAIDRDNLGKGEVRNVSSVVSRRPTISKTKSLYQIPSQSAILETPSYEEDTIQVFSASVPPGPDPASLLPADEDAEDYILPAARYVAGNPSPVQTSLIPEDQTAEGQIAEDQTAEDLVLPATRFGTGTPDAASTSSLPEDETAEDETAEDETAEDETAEDETAEDFVLPATRFNGSFHGTDPKYFLPDDHLEDDMSFPDAHFVGGTIHAEEYYRRSLPSTPTFEQEVSRADSSIVEPRGTLSNIDDYPPLEVLRARHFRNRSRTESHQDRHHNVAASATSSDQIEEIQDQSEAFEDQDVQQQQIQRSHRNASLLNGEIRTPVEPHIRQARPDQGDATCVNTHNNYLEPQSTSFQGSFTQTESSNGFNKDFGRNGRYLKWFRFGRKNQQASPVKYRKLGIKDLFSGCGLPSFRRRRCSPPSSPPPYAPAGQGNQQRQMQTWMSYDGAFSPKSSLASSHLNKPLPLSPGDRPQINYSRPRSASPTRPSSNSTATNTLSTSSTHVSNISSKKEFRAITADLLRQQRMNDSPTLSPSRKARRIAGVALEPQKHSAVTPPPLTFTSVSQRNPFTDAPIAVSPTATSPRPAARDPMDATPPVPSLPSSRSEPSSYYDHSPSQLPISGYYGTHSFARTPSTSPHKYAEHSEERRGRTILPQTPAKDTETYERGRGTSSKPAKRSRSPVKRLLGLGKDTPDKVSKQSEGLQPRDVTPASTSKRSLKDWGSRIRNGFVNAETGELERETHLEEYSSGATAKKVLPPATFPISLDPSYQARLVADLELMLVVSANRFLLREAKEGRISGASISKTRRNWEDRNFAQVVEYQFDQGTQRALILENLRTIEFCGEIANEPSKLAGALQAWGTIVFEMSVRTFCAGDSVIRKWLNDLPRIFEMLGAPFITFQTFEKIQTKTQLVIGQRQRQRQRSEKSTNEAEAVSSSQRSASPSRQVSDSSYVFRGPAHNRSVSNDSYIQGTYGGIDAQAQALEAMPTSTGNYTSLSHRNQSPEQWRAVTRAPSVGSLAHQPSHFPRDAYENSRGGRLGIMRNVSAETDVYSPQTRGYREI